MLIPFPMLFPEVLTSQCGFSHSLIWFVLQEDPGSFSRAFSQCVCLYTSTAMTFKPEKMGILFLISLPIFAPMSFESAPKGRESVWSRGVHSCLHNNPVPIIQLSG